MQKFSTPFKVGFVILVGLVMAVVMIIRFSANWGQDNGTYELKAYFNDATGLAPKSQIKVAGIQVGEVSSIRLEGSRALVTFKIRDDIELWSGTGNENDLVNGATVAKKLSGILGDYHLEITPGIDGKRLENGDFVPTVLQGKGIEGVMGSADTILKDVAQVTHNLANIFGGEEGKNQLVSAIRDLNDTIATVKTMANDNSQQISAIVDHLEKMSQNFAAMSETSQTQLPELLREVTELVQTAQNTLNRVNNGVGNTLDTTQQSVEDLRATIEKLDETVANVQTIVKNVEQGQGTVGKLLKDDDIANETHSLLSESRDLVKEGTKTIRDANSLISPFSGLDVDVSLRGDYFVRANAFRVDFGVKLEPNPDKYYYLGLVMDPHGTTKTKSILTESTATGTTYETITTNDDSIKFSAQYARRWRWFVGRFGIFENTGGLGGDILLFDDDWRISAEIFAFNDNEYPRFRATTLIYTSLFLPWKWAKTFYISAGVDDPINTDVIDGFVGIGFRFNDNDLKSFIGMVPK